MALAGPISQASSLGVHAPPAAPTSAGPTTAGAAVAGGPTAAALSAGPAPFHARSSNATLKPQWWDVTSESTTPFPVEEFTQGTWDGADDGVLFYGGGDYNVNLNGTWLYETGQWTEVTTLGNPGPISRGSLAYDPQTAYSVFYGGVSSFSPVVANNTTYYYARGIWSQHSLPVNPPVVVAGQMAYDPELNGIVLFGGEDATTSLVTNQTWLFDNGSWSHLSTPHAPPARWLSQMAYDPALGELVLYGGFDQSGNWLGDTWVFANGSWSSVNAAGLGVPPLGAGNMIYDPDLGTMVLVGGLNSAGQIQTGTWQFNGAVWSVLASQGGPHGHEAGIGVWDPADHELVLAGGGGPGSGSYTDVLSIPLTPVNVTAPLETDVGVVTNFTANAIGGAPPYTFSWNWGDDTTTAGPLATHTYAAPNAYVVTLTVRGPASNPATWQREITVAADPVPKLVTAPRGLDAGVPFSISATATGGVAPFRYSWSLSDGGTGHGATLNHTFATSGEYVLNLTTLDSVGGSGSALYDLTVNATPTVGIAPVNAPEAGASTTFQAAIDGGTPPFTYAWQFQGGATSQAASPKHTFTAAGMATVSVNITDANGVSAQTTSSIDVVAGVVVSIQGPIAVTTGDTPTFTANVSQGVEPYAVSWTLPSGAVSNGTSTSYNFPGPGVYEITAHVVDANGVRASATLNVTVQSSSSLFGGSVGGVPTVALLVGGVVVVAAVVAALYFLRRRGSAPPPEGA